MADTAIIARPAHLEDSEGGVVFTFDAVRSTEVERSITVSEYPLEDGASVADHAHLDPIRIQVAGVITATPLGVVGPAPTRHLDLAAQLTRVLERMEPVTLVTSLGVYRQMLLTRVPLRLVGGSVQGEFAFRQVQVVSQELVEIPPEVPQVRHRAGAPETQDVGQQATDQQDVVQWSTRRPGRSSALLQILE